MKIIKSIKQMQSIVANLKKNKKTIAFVPTMGYLHQGHLSLMKKADILIVSIFVNPTQFGPKEDFKKYPRDFKKDVKILAKANVDYLFYPKTEEMYSENYKTFVLVEDLSSKLCGVFRPTHFKGVATIVLKLFNIVQPDIAYFGQKDAQQVIIIKKMVKDLNLKTKIKVMPTIREKDGLAISSRNTYLNKKERISALVLINALRLALKLYKNGETNTGKIIKEMKDLISKEFLAKIDYIAIVDQENLEPVRKVNKGNLVALAVRIGKVRLIDNIIIGK